MCHPGGDGGDEPASWGPGGRSNMPVHVEEMAFSGPGGFSDVMSLGP